VISDYSLKEKFIKKYKDAQLEDIIPGLVVKTLNRSCYKIETKLPLTIKTVSFSKTWELLGSDLKLVRGIGNVTEQKLKAKNIKTIADLLFHVKYNVDAERFLDFLNNKNTIAVLNWISKRHSVSSIYNIYVSGLHHLEDFLFLDIETLGLSLEPIILIGIGQVSENNITVHQYLARNLNEEYAILAETLKHIHKNSALVTFNGRKFDVPYLRSRSLTHSIEAWYNVPNFDILPISRVAWTNVPDHRLGTLEKLVGVEREEDMPSALVPDFYNTYLETGNVGPLVPIITHNRQDIVSLAALFSKLIEETLS
jgi:hypothetical protein